jgi:hypothetical protein
MFISCLLIVVRHLSLFHCPAVFSFLCERQGCPCTCKYQSIHVQVPSRLSIVTCVHAPANMDVISIALDAQYVAIY